jgi:hypothetical protein
MSAASIAAAKSAEPAISSLLMCRNAPSLERLLLATYLRRAKP